MKMECLLHIIAIVAAGLSVAVGDVFIKKAGSVSSNMASAMVHPLIAAALCLYTLQILLFAYIFVRRWDLGIVALLQMACYSATCVLLGRFLFGERITVTQGLGMLMAFCGAALMNGGR